MENPVLEPAPARIQGTHQADFIKSYLAVMASTDFFTAEVLTLKQLVTYYALCFIELGSRLVHVGGITRHPD